MYGDGLAEEAGRAAQWSIPSFRLPLSFRAVSHREVTEAEIQEANLILFGARQNNTPVDRFADRLPMELNASAALRPGGYCTAGAALRCGEFGVAVVDGGDEAHRPGMQSPNPPSRVLESFGDDTSFRGSLANVIAEGRFDADWRVPAAAAARLVESGAVVVNEVSTAVGLEFPVTGTLQAERRQGP